jgi:hypothetical protein
MHNQVIQWINPRFGVEEVLTNWTEISDGLAEANRRRKFQITRWIQGL